MKANPLFSSAVLTLFPEMFPGPLGHSLAGKALQNGLWSLDVVNIWDFTVDKHSTVDDSPYGGGTGMIMKPDVVSRAVEFALHERPRAQVIYPSPRGKPLTQSLAKELKDLNLVILCGRFEGVDQRAIDHHDMLEVSLGDFVLSGGEIAAMAILDACVRLLPGVIGKESALAEESFNNTSEYAGLLEYPHYTRPSFWNGMPVPEVLLSGNHEQIRLWRLEQAKKVTEARRPDLMDKWKREKELLP